MRDIIKNVLGSSSGIMRNTAHYFQQNRSASISVSKQRICGIQKGIQPGQSVDVTLDIACSAVFRAAPANHFA